MEVEIKNDRPSLFRGKGDKNLFRGSQQFQLSPSKNVHPITYCKGDGLNAHYPPTRLSTQKKSQALTHGSGVAIRYNYFAVNYDNTKYRQRLKTTIDSKIQTITTRTSNVVQLLSKKGFRQENLWRSHFRWDGIV